MAADPDYFQRHDVVIFQGDDWALPITARSGADPIDLTGSTIRATVKRDDQAATISCPFTDAEAGTFVPQLARAVTTTMDTGAWSWDLVIRDSLGKELTRTGGAFVVVERATPDA